MSFASWLSMNDLSTHRNGDGTPSALSIQYQGRDDSSTPERTEKIRQLPSWRTPRSRSVITSSQATTQFILLENYSQRPIALDTSNKIPSSFGQFIPNSEHNSPSISHADLKGRTPIASNSIESSWKKLRPESPQLPSTTWMGSNSAIPNPQTSTFLPTAPHQNSWWREQPLILMGSTNIAITSSKIYEQLIEESPGPVPKSLRPQVATRPVAKEWSLIPGSIVWMPTQNAESADIHCLRENHCERELLNSTGYNHPGIILGCHSELLDGIEEKYCTIAQLRTYKMTPPAEYLRLREIAQQFRESVPIRYPGTGNRLDSVNPLELQRGHLHNQTYVQLQHVFRVPAELIMVFHHGSALASDVRLTEGGYREMMYLFGYIPQPVKVPNFPRWPLKQAEDAPEMQGSFVGNWTKATAGKCGKGGRRRSSGG